MKKGSILLVGVLAMFATSCGFKSEESPLSGTLVTYTAEGTQKGEILLGVKDKAGKKDKTIVPADTYVSITADNNYIICVQENADYSVLTSQAIKSARKPSTRSANSPSEIMFSTPAPPQEPVTTTSPASLKSAAPCLI